MLHHYQQAQFMQSILSSFQNPYMSFIGNANPNINCVNEQYNLKQNGYYNYSNIIIDNNRDNNVNRRKPSGNGIKKKMSSPGIAFNTNKFNSYNCQSETQHSKDDFISFMKTRKNNIIEYLSTQRGAKEVEKILKHSPNECINILLEHINTSLTKIMIHLYGNYFCQKVIQISSPEQITTMLTLIANDFPQIAKDYSGTHVLQALLDVISTQEQMYLILYSIENKVLEMAYDNNATHVLQKVIQVITEDKRSTINESIINDFKNLSLSPQGICVIKKYIATNTISKNKNRIIKIIIENCLELSQDPFGNYTIQTILEEWGCKDCNEIINIVIKNFIKLSKQKFSSNVVEKIVEISDDKQRKEIYDIIVNSGEIEELVKNKYGKFVFQKCVKKCSFRQREVLISLFDKINYTSLNGNNSNKGSNNKIQNEEVVQV